MKMSLRFRDFHPLFLITFNHNILLFCHFDFFSTSHFLAVVALARPVALASAVALARPVALAYEKAVALARPVAFASPVLLARAVAFS
jgi:hypothetical protein